MTPLEKVVIAYLAEHSNIVPKWRKCKALRKEMQALVAFPQVTSPGQQPFPKLALKST